jgi:predicted glycoside hydrolase/deacetylase ChbG (UPF0249 family)
VHAATTTTVEAVTTLAERLGHPPDARLLIVNASDLGLCHSANVSVFQCLRSGLVTSASLMVPGPWAREAAARYRGEDVGVHLTVNAEHDLYRWGPITHAPSLLGGDGGFPHTMEDVWDHADPDEVRRECRAQIERAILWGFDVSHLDTHMATLLLRPELYDVYLDLAVEFRLPIRLFGDTAEEFLGFPARELAAEEGLIFPDQLLTAPGVGTRALVRDHLANLEPGVTELLLQPAVDSAELRSLAADWATRADDHRLVCEEPFLRDAVARAGVILTGYRELRALARDEVPSR